ncbi:hypothetical protein IRP63_14720 (plasmid) [Clostridium botulinum]|uniref:Uncharacterized protein n=1 Tax=Clostridium botulinum C/D str. DC5 TaxID=1443128 RepID=A0A0A0HZ43_CLOBO|nr:hypothetical protein [Clostridium botulinum]KGM93351.1 hypothetical protein Z955_15370 [Clostridium botulinum C/D str. DC5]KOC56966.1 hypothetical protein ADU89_01900 [Clostridium botulinum]KOC57441.1 hypothetical protein ADU90_06440 [Clostridium botulinum]MCD3232684.1 hypothetical protein [Clostridium botulinum D/C]MCD3238386.1 hypothetical protein [Clostridium botulinum D/C]
MEYKKNNTPEIKSKQKTNNTIVDKYLNKRTLAMKTFLVIDELSNCLFEEYLLDDSSLGESIIALYKLRNYLLENNLRGDVNVKAIEQAYKSKQYTKLKMLMEEKFLQLFTPEEFNLFIEIFKYNKWSWFELLNKFNIRKCNVFTIIQCSPM